MLSCVNNGFYIFGNIFIFQEAICNDCMVVQHKQSEHDISRIADVETQNLEELHAMVRETKRKAETCRGASTKLETIQQELQEQRDDAKGLIQETFQSLKAVLDKRQVGIMVALSPVTSCRLSCLIEGSCRLSCKPH